MKKFVLAVALSIFLISISCNKKVETSNDINTNEEQIIEKSSDGLVKDTVAPMVQPKDSISKY